MRGMALAAAVMLVSLSAPGDEVEIRAARFEQANDGTWRASVTLAHEDTGWEHYADAWRVVSTDGTVYGTRTLYHPHVDEQPFTRSLGSIPIPASVITVHVEAHDKVHGWSAQRLEVRLDQESGPGFEVRR